MKELAHYFIYTAYIVAGLINVIPSVGVLSNRQLTRLYGLEVSSPDLSLLLRHRAVLFLIVGMLLWWTVWRPEFRTEAAIAGLVSMLSFVVIALPLPLDNRLLSRVVKADIFASALLLPAWLLDMFWIGLDR